MCFPRRKGKCGPGGGWTTTTMAADSRRLLHYFRLLPDRRFLFGGRGGTDASLGGLSRIDASLRHTFDRMFPAWAGVETEYRWAGLVGLAAGLTPYAGPVDGLDDSNALLAWHGNGVAMASFAGARMADFIAGAARLFHCARHPRQGACRPLPRNRPHRTAG